LVDTVPLLVLFIPVALKALDRKKAAMALFVFTVVWSIGVQVIGAFAYTPGGWNARRVPNASDTGKARLADIDMPEYRSRLWSLSDNQISFYLSHFSEQHRLRQKEVEAWIDQNAYRISQD
jgi:hypothetical protein